MQPTRVHFEGWALECLCVFARFTAKISLNPQPHERVLMTIDRLTSIREEIAAKPTLSINEAAALSGFSRNTITRIFADVNGVIVLNRPEQMYKRRYRTIRIPRAVYERTIGKLKN